MLFVELDLSRTIHPYLTHNFFARASVFYHFCLEGVFVSIWSAANPSLQEKLVLTDGAFGSAVLFFYLGTVCATPFCALFIRLIGSKFACFLGALIFGLCINLIALADSLIMLMLAMMIFGLGCGLMDITMNSCGVLTELIVGYPILGAYHGSYSIAAAIGAQIAGVLLGAGWSPAHMFLMFSILATILTILAMLPMYDKARELNILATHKDVNLKQQEKADAAPTCYSSTATVEANNINLEATDNPISFTTSDSQSDLKSSCKDLASNFTVDVFNLAVVGFLASFGEGSIVTWATIYFFRELNATELTQNFGFTAFMVCMAVGRFSSDFLRRQVGRQRIMLAAGVIAASGLGLAVATPSFPHEDDKLAVATLGFALAGIGLSTLVPTVFSTAGHLPGMSSGTVLSIVAAFTYSGSIVAPPMVGGISDRWGLRVSLFVVAMMLLIISTFAYRVPYEANEMDKRKRQSQKINAEESITSPLLEH